jgi:Transposase zinc-binding domain/Putative transposase
MTRGYSVTRGSTPPRSIRASPSRRSARSPARSNISSRGCGRLHKTPLVLPRPPLEVADIFRAHGPAWRCANVGHVSLDQLKVMSVIESCRTAALGGHVARGQTCRHTLIANNSCRNRHCPRCQGLAAQEWLAEREAELRFVPYYHVMFTLPAAIADIAYHNKAAIYDGLFEAAAETLTTIAADPKHLGARIGFIAVLHSWGSVMTHHPHLHIIVPGGGIARDGQRWISCRPGFFLSVRVLSRLFRRLFLQQITTLHAAGRLRFFGDHARLSRRGAFARLSRTDAQARMDRLQQAPIRRPRRGVGLSLALHPPHRHLEQPARHLRRHQRDL